MCCQSCENLSGDGADGKKLWPAKDRRFTPARLQFEISTGYVKYYSDTIPGTLAWVATSTTSTYVPPFFPIHLRGLVINTLIHLSYSQSHPTVNTACSKEGMARWYPTTCPSYLTPRGDCAITSAVGGAWVGSWHTTNRPTNTNAGRPALAVVIIR